MRVDQAAQDIAPNFAGTLFGLSNSIAAIGGFVAPRIAGQLVNSDTRDVSKWRIVWIIAVVILVIETVFYTVFAAGNPQTWNFLDSQESLEDGRRRDKDWFLVSQNLTQHISKIVLFRSFLL